MYRLNVEWTNSQHWLGRRVLVTGASGFLGHALCRLLCEAGAEVHGTWRSRPPDSSVLAHHAVLPADAHELIQQIRPERVFHLASPIDHSTDTDAYARLLPGILGASMAVAQACQKFGARLIHIGTCAEYGDLPSPLHESTLCRPNAPYGMLKLAATHAVLSMTRSTPLHAVVLRPFRAHGPNDRTSLVAQACHAAVQKRSLSITSGKQIREWNGVYEIAEAIMAAGAHTELSGEVLNIGGGPKASVRSVVERIFELAGADTELIKVGALASRDGDPVALWSDSTKAREMLCMNPPLSLEESLADTLAWHQSLTSNDSSP